MRGGRGDGGLGVRREDELGDVHLRGGALEGRGIAMTCPE